MDSEKNYREDVVPKEVGLAASDTSADSSVDPESQHAKIMAAQRKVDKRLFLWYVAG